MAEYLQLTRVLWVWDLLSHHFLVVSFTIKVTFCLDYVQNFSRLDETRCPKHDIQGKSEKNLNLKKFKF